MSPRSRRYSEWGPITPAQGICTLPASRTTRRSWRLSKSYRKTGASWRPTMYTTALASRTNAGFSFQPRMLLAEHGFAPVGKVDHHDSAVGPPLATHDAPAVVGKRLGRVAVLVKCPVVGQPPHLAAGQFVAEHDLLGARGNAAQDGCRGEDLHACGLCILVILRQLTGRRSHRPFDEAAHDACPHGRPLGYKGDIDIARPRHSV